MEHHFYLLKEGESYIQLKNLLQILGLAQTGGHAKLMIKQHEVLWNGEYETQVRKKVRAGDQVELVNTAMITVKKKET